MPFCEHTVAAGLPQGRYIASKRVRCRIVDILTGQVLEEEQRHGDAVTSVHFTAHGELVSSSGDRCIHLWKVPTAPPPSSNPPKASLRPPQLSLPHHTLYAYLGAPHKRWFRQSRDMLGEDCRSGFPARAVCPLMAAARRATHPPSLFTQTSCRSATGK